MTKCTICHEVADHPDFKVKEMQYCLMDSFEYFQCINCHCIQIKSIPGNISKYYPSNYYSFSDSLGNDLLEKRADFFHRTQAAHFTGKKSFLGTIFSLGYHPSLWFEWVKLFCVSKNDRILDIGTGSGLLLKKMWHHGYDHLAGVDPFISQDYIFPGKLQILKKDPLLMDESKSFDLIMMHHSLEHMSDQDGIIAKVRKLLAPSGKLLVRIPVYSKVLMEKYGTSLVSLDAPRHFFIHSIKSFSMLAERNGFKVQRIVFDADSSSLWASEQYKQGICMNAPNSYSLSRKASPFSKKQIQQFKKEIGVLNKKKESDTAAFYLVKNS
ncbi:MAG: class I SAM-dependent methyltransferase [Flavisolibacter sp.]